MGMDDEIAMHEIINQTSIDKQEDVHDALAGYNNVEEVVEQDLLRMQFDRVDEDFEIHEVFAVDSVDVGDMVENSGDNIMEKIVLKRMTLLIGETQMIVFIIMIIWI